MADTSHNWICKRCTGRGQHFLTCPVLQLGGGDGNGGGEDQAEVGG
jgi:hypothetical protein